MSLPVYAILVYYYVGLKRYVEVEPLYVRALKIFKTRLGDQHPYTQEMIRRFVAFLRQMIAANRTAELLDEPLTQELLQELQTEIRSRLENP